MQQQSKQKIYIVGIGMGNPDTLTIKATNIISQSKCLIGAKRMVENYKNLGITCHQAVRDQEIIDYIGAHPELATITVLMSGDVGFYSGAKKLVQGLVGYDVELVCGISSVVYFCAKLQTPWEDVHLASVHGRDCNVVAQVMNHPKVFLLTGGEATVAEICQKLSQSNLDQVKVSVGEQLSYAEETITIGTAAELQAKIFDSLSVMLIENPGYLKNSVVTTGLEDDCFIRGEVPMTKSEVRSIALSKLGLKADDVVYDVGAGTGSVAIEAALQARLGTVFAIERKPEALDLIEKNRAKFGLANVQIVPGVAPAVLASLPSPDAVFIGGSAGQMEQILSLLLDKNPEVRVVVNAIAVETLAESLASMQKLNFVDLEVTQVSISKARVVANYHLMTGQNPIFIISGRGQSHGDS